MHEDKTIPSHYRLDRALEDYTTAANNCKKYRAIKYIRLSDSDGNLNESDSIINQRRLIDEFIKKNPDIEDVGEKIDDGYSGIILVGV